MTDTLASRRPIALGIFLIVAGVIGWWAAFQLTVEKFALLTNPNEQLGCDFSLLVQCKANLESWQGSLFGFPNPLLGLTGWVAVIVVGAALLSGAKFSRWFWILFNIGIVGALALVIWLISQSIFVLITLCPWCMVTWAVTIPVFWAVTLRNLSTGVIPTPPRLRRFFTGAYGWVAVITLVSYLVVAVIAQVRLDVISTLF